MGGGARAFPTPGAAGHHHLIYLILGCIMDSLSMIMLTIPIFFPIIMGMDFWGLDPEGKAIWFGILSLMVVEIGLITPPVGLNVFIISSMAKDTSMKETFIGIIPFLMSDIAANRADRLCAVDGADRAQTLRVGVGGTASAVPFSFRLRVSGRRIPRAPVAD
jgi:hypothetical protein